jgi:RNA polymerase sigma factor (sigma-70 family)
MNQDTIPKALDGDPNAFESLVEEHQGRWIRMGMSVLGNRVDALDAFQEGVIRVFRSLKSFRHESSFTTWASKIMMNTYLQQRRSLSRRRLRETAESDIFDINDVADQKATDADIMDRERTGALRNAIKRLPTQQQLAVILKYDGQLTINQVAESMDCTPGTVKRYLHRAMGKLQRDLRDYFK